MSFDQTLEELNRIFKKIKKDPIISARVEVLLGDYPSSGSPMTEGGKRTISSLKSPVGEKKSKENKSSLDTRYFWRRVLPCLDHHCTWIEAPQGTLVKHQPPLGRGLDIEPD
jgi:hypothetical protein